MQKRAFQGLKRTFIHVSDLLPLYFDKKTNLESIWTKYGGGRPETCINVHFD